MKIALIADIHSNLPALESVLRDIRRHSPDRIISLGDQVNLGPCPRETLALLGEAGALCLHGNHERYILSAMAGDPGYDGANFDLVRYQKNLLTREDITFPETIELCGVTFCHAMPGDDRFPVFEYDLALPRLRQMTFPKPTHIICGHGHNPTHISLPNFTLDSIGSAGCMDDGVPGAAPYAILTIEKDHTFLRPYEAHYDVSRIKPLFKKSGMADCEPIMAHINCLQMMTNSCFLVDFVSRALAISRARGEEMISPETWQDADRAFPWPDSVGTAQFWRTA